VVGRCGGDVAGEAAVGDQGWGGVHCDCEGAMKLVYSHDCSLDG
jgi:hypothetical protein